MKKIDKLSDSLDEAVKNLNDISNRLKEMQELMLKLWRAEDMEENDGELAELTGTSDPLVVVVFVVVDVVVFVCPSLLFVVVDVYPPVI